MSNFLYPSVADLLNIIPPYARVAGFDIGKKRIGLAMASVSPFLITPYKTLHRTKHTQDIVFLKKYMIDFDIRGAIIGLPLNMDGSFGNSAQSITALGTLICNDLKLPFCFYDERLSSATAEGKLSDAGIPAIRHKPMIDAMAAAVILESAIPKNK